MNFDPPAQISVYNWKWKKWLLLVSEWIEFEGSTETVITTTHTAGAKQTLLVDDDAAGGAVTITLPKVINTNRIMHIKKIGTTGNVTLDGDGSETIDGSATHTLTTQYQSVSIMSSGTEWYIV